jgi:hypothetical protein
MRFVIVHYHLYKNAGSTIDSILDRNFHGEERGHIEGPYPWSMLKPSDLLDYTLANPRLRAISTHQARLPLPQHPEVTFLPLLFLRDPIDRFGSVYSFERKQPAESLSPSTIVARRASLPEFAEWVVGRDGTAVCRNFQVVHLSAEQRDVPEGRATPGDYDAALAQLKSLPFFGLVELFDESIQAMGDYLRPHFGELEFHHSPINVTAERKSTLEQRLKHIREELGPSLYRELLEHNALDVLLYREAQQMFEARQRARAEQSEQSEQPGQPTPQPFARRIMHALLGTR